MIRCRRCESFNLYTDEHNDLCCVMCGELIFDNAELRRQRLYDAISAQAEVDNAREQGEQYLTKHRVNKGMRA